MDSKTCPRCKKPVAVEEYGKAAYCKPCWREYSREYYKAHRKACIAATVTWINNNKRRFLDYQKELRARHPERIAQQNKQWREGPAGQRWKKKNRKKRNELSRKWTKNNPEKKRASRRKSYLKRFEADKKQRRTWVENNRDRVRANDRERYRRDRQKRIAQQHIQRAKRNAAPGSHTTEEFGAVLRAQQFKCFYCRTSLDYRNVVREHKTPLSRSGSNDIANIVAACKPCNSRKSNLTEAEFRSEYYQLITRN